MKWTESGKDQSIQCGSRFITNVERSYSACNHKTLVVVFGSKMLGVYLWFMVSTTILTDRQALLYSLKINNDFRRLIDGLDFCLCVSLMYCTD